MSCKRKYVEHVVMELMARRLMPTRLGNHGIFTVVKVIEPEQLEDGIEEPLLVQDPA